MDKYLLYEAFKRGHLISWSPNRSYFECQYNYVTKLKTVCKWRRKRGLPACSKKGEAICKEKLLNFFEEKEHKDLEFAQQFQK